MQRFLNIACGAAYIKSPEWENLDYAPRDSFVRRSDVLGNLTTSQTKYEVIYCAHFIEHIPPEKAGSFLSRCKSLTREGSLVRIVTPDAEFLLREYLKHKDSGNGAYAEFAFLNFLDQCVRLKGGGKLQERFEQLASGKLKKLEEYAEYLNGTDVKATISGPAATRMDTALALFNHPSRIWAKIEPSYIRAVCALLPKAFREQNVSFAPIGEKHLWMYDFDSLKTLLNEAGFSHVEKRTFNTSLRTDKLFEPLELIDGRPRKGNHQLFVEAQV